MGFEYEEIDLATAGELDTTRGSMQFHLPSVQETNSATAAARAAGKDERGHWVIADPLNIVSGPRQGAFHRDHVAEFTKRIVLVEEDDEALGLDELDHDQRLALSRSIYERFRGGRTFGELSQLEMCQFEWIATFDPPAAGEWVGY